MDRSMVDHTLCQDTHKDGQAWQGRQTDPETPTPRTDIEIRSRNACPRKLMISLKVRGDPPVGTFWQRYAAGKRVFYMRITIIQHSFIIIPFPIHQTPTTINPLYNYRFTSDTFYADDTVVLLSRFAGLLHRNKANVLYMCCCAWRWQNKQHDETYRFFGAAENGGKSDWVVVVYGIHIGVGNTMRIR